MLTLFTQQWLNKTLFPTSSATLKEHKKSSKFLPINLSTTECKGWFRLEDSGPQGTWVPSVMSETRSTEGRKGTMERARGRMSAWNSHLLQAHLLWATSEVRPERRGHGGIWAAEEESLGSLQGKQDGNEKQKRNKEPGKKEVHQHLPATSRIHWWLACLCLSSPLSSALPFSSRWFSPSPFAWEEPPFSQSCVGEHETLES